MQFVYVYIYICLALCFNLIFFKNKWILIIFETTKYKRLQSINYILLHPTLTQIYIKYKNKHIEKIYLLSLVY